MSSRPSMDRLARKPTIPNGELRWFRCVACSEFGPKANQFDIMSTGGRSAPDPLPYTAEQLGVFEEHDLQGGDIGRFRRCWQAWERLRSRSQIILDEFYCGTVVGGTSPSAGQGKAGLVLPEPVAVGLMLSIGKRGVRIRTAEGLMRELELGHTLWEIERCRSEDTWTQYKTGIVRCPT